MPKQAKSHVNKNGQARYRFTGRYNETTREAENEVINDAPSALRQKNLAPKGEDSAAASTLRKVRNELSW